MAECPDTAAWEGMIHGRLASADAARLSIHLGTCAECRAAYEEMCRNEMALGALRDHVESPTVTVSRDAGAADAATAGAAAASGAAASTRSGASVSAPTGAAPERPDMIGPYRLVRVIGSGGMGVVHLAVREGDQIRPPVALKVLKTGLSTADVLRRFHLERQLLASLNHPNIARLYDAGETADGRPYFVMEHVEGQPLTKYCDTQRLTVAERLELFRSVCSAVHHAHRNLVVHRDLKPGNVLVTADGVPKLLDFGIAKLINPGLSPAPYAPTRPELRAMTPDYASPEQVRGDPISTASDVYSLGVMLYELVCGHRPHRLHGLTATRIEQAVCEIAPERPSRAAGLSDPAGSPGPDGRTGPTTPAQVAEARQTRPERLRRQLEGDIDNIVLMAMRKEPARRYASAEQLAEDIGRHLAGRPVIARADTIGYRMAKFIRRNRTGVAAAALVAFALIVAVAGTTSAWLHSRQQRDRAESMFDEGRQLAHTLLFELHDSIQELDGSVPARELLATSARQYLDRLREQMGERPELMRELAASYDKLGSIRGGVRNPSLGDTAGALEAYRIARDMRQALLAASPDDQALAADLFTSHLHVADMLKKRGDVAGALNAYRQAVGIAEQLHDKQPDSVEDRRRLDIARSSVGAMLARTGAHEEALEHYRRSLEVRRAAAAEHPGDRLLQRDLSVGHLRVGGQLEASGDRRGAMEHYRAAYEIRQRLAEDEPTSGRAWNDLAVAGAFVAQAHLELGELEPALAHLGRQLALCRARVQENPSDARSRQNLAFAHLLAGDARSRQEQWLAALDHFQECRALVIELSESDPQNTLYREMLGRAYEGLGQVARSTGDALQADARYRQALEIFESLAAADPADARWQEAQARVRRALESEDGDH